jgi:xanthine dehydrogenase small subunit
MSGSLRFVLDGRVRELHDVDPTLTVLQWLRGVERRCGTKEGCAEGDCGACTVVLGELHQGRVRLRAVNSCLLFLPALDGKALFTVESLRGSSGALHPVQQALVECHGSQCGFCTPGFVMSLFALYESEPRPSRARLDDVLSGNLCRCTGYRPIADAVQRAYQLGRGAGAAARNELEELLRSIAHEETLALESGGRRFLAPRTIEGLVALLERYPQAHLLAGGTDVGLWVTKEHRSLETLIWLGAVEELARVTAGETHLEIGAAATYSDLQPLVADHYPALGALVRRIGSTQIRNLGTLGGNLANGSPVADMSPSLLALDAGVVLRHGGERRELPLGDFFLDYRKTALRQGEFLERVRLPVRSPHRQYRVYKVTKRFDQDISTVCGAFSVELERGQVSRIRIAYGGMAAIPKRARSCEESLTGRPWTEASVREALQVLDGELTPISDLRASARYRRLLAGNLLRKFQLETSGALASDHLGLAEENS